MESADGLHVYSSKELESITNGFSQENFIEKTQFGKVYRGKIQQNFKTQEVTVKTWEDRSTFGRIPRDQVSVFRDEINFLTNSDMKLHPNVAKVIGYCCDNGRLGAVYDLRPLNTLHNLYLQDNFKWIARIKVALGFACFLESLHGQGLWIRNIDGVHIMVDKAFNPRFIDFGMVVGGCFGVIPASEFFVGCLGYVDAHICAGWSNEAEVYAYGTILLSLVAKRVLGETKLERQKPDALVDKWAKAEYKKRKSKSLVHQSLVMEPFFDARDGVKITKLAMRCVEYFPEKRPTMKEVVCCLQKLKTVQRYRDLILGMPEMFVGGVDALQLLGESSI